MNESIETGSDGHAWLIVLVHAKFAVSSVGDHACFHFADLCFIKFAVRFRFVYSGGNYALQKRLRLSTAFRGANAPPEASRARIRGSPDPSYK